MDAKGRFTAALFSVLFLFVVIVRRFYWRCFMRHSIYSVKDKAANAYLQPFFTVNEATAIRSLRAVLADPQHTFAQNAKDFSLYLVGHFHDDDGMVLPLAEPNFVVNLETLMEASNG